MFGFVLSERRARQHGRVQVNGSAKSHLAATSILCVFLGSAHPTIMLSLPSTHNQLRHTHSWACPSLPLSPTCREICKTNAEKLILLFYDLRQHRAEN